MITHPRDAKGIPKEAFKAIEPTTADNHIKLLRLVHKFSLREENRTRPLDHVMLAALMEARHQAETYWMWGTMQKYMGALMGALQRLSLYSNSGFDLQLNHSKVWTSVHAYVKHQSNLEPKHVPVTVSSTEIHQAVKFLSDTKWEDRNLSIALIIAWLTSGRFGCIMQLTRGDIKLSPAPKGKGMDLDVTFMRGKVVKKTGPYTIHTAVEGEWIPMLQSFLDSFPDTPDGHAQFLWPEPDKNRRARFGQKIRDAIRKFNPLSEQRSVRRSALQRLASMIPGITKAQLRAFSLHTTDHMLNRYLNWGKAEAGVAMPQRSHARAALTRKSGTISSQSASPQSTLSSITLTRR